MANRLYGCLWLSPKAATEAADEALYFFALSPANDWIPTCILAMSNEMASINQKQRFCRLNFSVSPMLPSNHQHPRHPVSVPIDLIETGQGTMCHLRVVG